MSRLAVTASPLAGVCRVDRAITGDARGFLARLFCADELAAAGWPGSIAQVNHSMSARRGTIRGLHFQYPPHAEAKLVSCIRGRIFDVAVDVRAGSPTFLHWHGELLSAADGGALLIPPGFAHGFQTLSDEVELIYCHSRAYAPGAEAGLDPFDPLLNIAWPEPATEVSQRDRHHAALHPAFQGVVL